MINTSNFRDLLLSLNFNENDDFFEKKFSHCEDSLKVDFTKKKLIYPEKILGREFNDGFDAPENFVVFECVHRLLSKGYRPAHIQLEKAWHLGHEAKSGRADICVYSPVDGKQDEKGSLLFIIECKTWGREFDKALQDTKSDGAQLFSYWQQEQSCKWLVLYASDFKDGTIVYKSPTINCSDDSNIAYLAKKDKTIKLYRDAHTTPEKYEAWKETYSSQIHEDLIFTDDSIAYQIGVKPLRKKNLRDFTPDDKIVNKFEEILRHNNVSDKENAFNRLVAMFICKLVDESTKTENDEVEFQYKQGTDTYETLQDRLQRLHRDGMQKFMKEEIYYVSSDYSEKLFQQYTGANRQDAINSLRDTIRKLKFYSNNDFAFKDVHNEELFYQNGKILVEMVQLFEKYRIVYPSKHQFLGDLFEQLLNKGFKQNEGQFFTPMPITRFIWDCLPIETMINSDRGTVYPKVIDYACGAGHFLTEAVEAINYFGHSDGDNSWTRDSIYGIEKDYRLARVAKISLFMNGAGEGNIIFGDGLENAPDKGIENGTFDILVANPPYSVKDFKQHLQLKNNNFDLLDKIGLNGGEIETLFVERIGQLLKPKGVAAVILPSSILSNDSASYIGAREQFLKNFYIRAIASFGSQTFGATGTNTVVMFLEKFNEPPKQIDLAKDTVEAIFRGDSLEGWKDKDVLEAYLSTIDVNEDLYRAFLQKKHSITDLSNVEYFNMYVRAFSNSKEIKDLKDKKFFQKMNDEEQACLYLEKFYNYSHSIEREKLFYFTLVFGQSTVIITAPADNKKQKDFLGYEWSNRKGNEGIKITKAGGQLYNDKDRSAICTLANVIRNSFNEETVFINEQQKNTSIISTTNILDFSRSSFNKAMRLICEKKVALQSKYPISILGNICDVIIGGTPSRNVPEYFTGNHLWVSIAEMQGQVITDTKEKITDEAINNSNVKLIQKGTTLLSFKLSIGKTAIAGKDLYTNEAIASLVPLDPAKLLDKYLFYVFNGKMIDLEKVGDKAFGKSLNSKYLKEEVRIPVPPPEIQQQIINECDEIEKEYNSTRMTIETYRKKIEELFDELDVISISTGGGKISLANTTMFDVSIGKRVLNSQLSESGAIPVFSANVVEPFGYIDDLLIDDFSIPSVLWGIDGDWMTTYIAENKEFYPTDHCGVLRCKTSDVNPRYLSHILEKQGIQMGFSRTYRASIDRVKGITFTVTDRDTQDKIIDKIFEIEGKIKENETSLETLAGKTSEILSRYLN